MAKFQPAKYTGKLHHHGCVRCRRRYWDACYSPEHDDVCTACHSGIPSSHQEASAPRPCCFTNSREALKEDRIVYKLAGPGPWFLCRTCARQFPYNAPKEQP